MCNGCTQWNCLKRENEVEGREADKIHWNRVGRRWGKECRGDGRSKEQREKKEGG